jgi:hypothetical protein
MPKTALLFFIVDLRFSNVIETLSVVVWVSRCGIGVRFTSPEAFDDLFGLAVSLVRFSAGEA